ncbi:MAG: PilZ domain-containing protein [Granulosicoccus sp.]|nr:PilZ domain-containing protein [Granulosicoccus sp.]
MIRESETTTDNAPERRQHVRIHDAVGLHVQRLADMPAAGQSVPAPVANTVRKADKYGIEGYREVRRDYPAVASYIDALEERIRELHLDGDVAASNPSHKVSLSAGGIYFADKQLLQPGEMVGITLTLFPGGKRIGSDARIVSGNESPDLARHDEPSYRAVFVRMSDADRQVIEEHVQRLLDRRTPLQE